MITTTRSVARAIPMRLVCATCRVPFGLIPVIAATAAMRAAAISHVYQVMRRSVSRIGPHVASGHTAPTTHFTSVAVTSTVVRRSDIETREPRLPPDRVPVPTPSARSAARGGAKLITRLVFVRVTPAGRVRPVDERPHPHLLEPALRAIFNCGEHRYFGRLPRIATNCST